MGQRRGLKLPLGMTYYAHGVNNIYEGLGNTYKGPGKLGVIGPTRQFYQYLLGNPWKHKLLLRRLEPFYHWHI